MSQKHTFEIPVLFHFTGGTPEEAYDKLHTALLYGNLSFFTAHIGLPKRFIDPYLAEKPTQTAENEGDGGGGPGLRP